MCSGNMRKRDTLRVEPQRRTKRYSSPLRASLPLAACPEGGVGARGVCRARADRVGGVWCRNETTAEQSDDGARCGQAAKGRAPTKVVSEAKRCSGVVRCGDCMQVRTRGLYKTRPNKKRNTRPQ